MHSFREVVGAARDLRGGGDDDPWLPRVAGKARLAVPGEKALLLPVEPAGFSSPGGTAERGLHLLGDRENAARRALIFEPGLVVPLKRPEPAELGRLGQDPNLARPSHNPRAVAASVAVDLDLDRGRVWGVGRLVVVEGALRPGSSLLVQQEVVWTPDQEEAELLLAGLHQDAADSVRTGPEPNTPPWRTVAVLLGDPAAAVLEPGWQRGLELAAGVRAVRLSVRTSPDSSKAAVIRDLRSNPPDALLVWEGGVASPPTYIEPYLAARADGYAHAFGGRDPLPLSEHLAELLMHLRDVAPLEFKSPSKATVANWTQAASAAEKLQGDHFVLTDRAKAMLKGNPYPRPARMLEHLNALADLARRYRAAGGELGGALTLISQHEHGIEIALTDKGLSPPVLTAFDDLQAEPHVKVDDVKSPDECGRIYFAIDRVNYRFIVDHVGLHNYG